MLAMHRQATAPPESLFLRDLQTKPDAAQAPRRRDPCSTYQTEANGSHEYAVTESYQTKTHHEMTVEEGHGKDFCDAASHLRNNQKHAE